MSMEQPKFNPSDPKYKKVADLPEDQRDNFVDVKGIDENKDGFITKEAAKLAADFEKEAKSRNKGLALKERIRGRGKTEGIELVQDQALTDNYFFEKEKKKEADWNEFLQSPDIVVYPHESSESPDRISLKSKNGETEYGLSYLLEKGLIKGEQIAEICEIKSARVANELMSDKAEHYFKPLAFRAKLNEGWAKRLGEILGKNIEVAKRSNE